MFGLFNKLIKKEKTDDYYSINEILELEADHNFIFGQRSNGKSYQVARYIFSQFLKDEDNNHFLYLRRFSEDLKILDLPSYFDGIPIEEMSKGKYNSIFCSRGFFYTCKVDEFGERTNIKAFGYYKPISQAERMKSNQFPTVGIIVLEEFMTIQSYLQSETFLVESIISTVSRSRKTKIFYIGNTESRYCPYFEHFKIPDIIRQEQGTILLYEHNEGNDENGNPIIIKVACERCNETIKSKSKMSFTNNSKTISTGSWASEDQPILRNPQNYKTIYSIVFEDSLFGFFAELKSNDASGLLFWYVSPLRHKPKRGERVITQEPSMDPMRTKGLHPLSDAELEVFRVFALDRIYFEDNLTGTEFKRKLKELGGL